MIITCGKSRTMVGQLYKNAQASGIDISERDSIDQKPIAGSPNAPVSDPQNNPNSIGLDQNVQQNKPIISPENKGSIVDRQTDEESDISKMVIDSLSKWGWPVRIVTKYKKNMVKEKLTPDGFGGIKKDITVTAPNTYYGRDQLINDGDFTNLVKSIEQFAKIKWVGGNRSGDVMTVNFSSDVESKAEDPVEQKLEKIYGKQPNNAEDKKTHAATLRELILARKDRLYRTLREIANKGKLQ